MPAKSTGPERATAHPRNYAYDSNSHYGQSGAPSNLIQIYLYIDLDLRLSLF